MFHERQIPGVLREYAGGRSFLRRGL